MFLMTHSLFLSPPLSHSLFLFLFRENRQALTVPIQFPEFMSNLTGQFSNTPKSSDHNQNSRHAEAYLVQAFSFSSSAHKRGLKTVLYDISATTYYIPVFPQNHLNSKVLNYYYFYCLGFLFTT